MTPLAVFVITLVIAILTMFTGLAWIAAPLFVLAFFALVWAIVVLARGGAQKPVMHRTRDAQLLGPGGPDDPDA
jgi:hypothetical protein